MKIDQIEKIIAFDGNAFRRRDHVDDRVGDLRSIENVLQIRRIRGEETEFRTKFRRPRRTKIVSLSP